jgi:WD and tetratricopeptide repeat-containing protein 1
MPKFPTRAPGPNDLPSYTHSRQLGSIGGREYQDLFKVTSSVVDRLRLEDELEGHDGCVNCLEWNEAGT